MSSYKYCAVTFCQNTTTKDPKKLFIHLPKEVSMRKKWLKLAGRELDILSSKSTMYFCEDHFDLPNDMENYMQYRLMGPVLKVRMIPNCVPSKLLCEFSQAKRASTTNSRYISKKKSRLLLEQEKETNKETTESSITLQTRATTLKTRWKNLRAYFIKLHRKVENPMSQTSTITWQFYDQLSFLKNAGKESLRADYDDTNSRLDNMPLSEAIDEHDKANSESDTNSVISQASQWKRRRITTSIQRNELLELERKKIEAYQNESIQERNDDLQFFESLLPYVKNIPLLQKLKLRCKIQEMVLNELEICENNAFEQHMHYAEVHVDNLQYSAEPNVLHLIKTEPGE